jgi:uncharacterized protein YyaL (SSP411 family)
MKLLPALIITIFLLSFNVIAADKKAISIAQNQADTVSFSARSAKLSSQLTTALNSMPAGYQPRTEHLLENGSPRFTNRLILEDSPYLIQHAHNPVDWYPWGTEAFEVAKRENKPVFLSIGYSTCHWCHVMEKESFENLEIADFINKNFIAIKVDRERRPDIDKTYMNAVMLMTGGGGWPMSSFLSPDGKPFFGGTYFPPAAFLNINRQVANAWIEIPQQLIDQGERVAIAVEQLSQRKVVAAKLSEQAVGRAISDAMSIHDSFQGGFGQAPKFPQEPLLFLLLEEAERNNNQQVLKAIEVTLDAMSEGGIYDQVGGGFHRYATDNSWLVPHFEKMLYNQAHLGRVFLLAWRLTGKPSYRRIATQTLDYVLRDLTSADGAFYSATDADSEGDEGIFFLWHSDQLRQLLSSQDAEMAIELFGVTDRGNFESANILHLPSPLSDFAERKGMSMDQLLVWLDRIREQLYQSRETREHPLRDEKIITAWNGMMIGTFAQAGELLGDQRYTDAAIRAAQFIWDNNRAEAGELWRVHLHGSSSITAKQPDYAYLAEGLLHLYDTTGESFWLQRSREIADAMIGRFWDEGNGGFYMSAEQEQLTAMARPKDGGTDNAIPSGNSVALRVMQMLAARSDSFEYSKRADAILAAFAGAINQNPTSFGYMLTGANNLRFGELSAQRYIARGGIKAKARQTGAGRIVVDISIPSGWHINANKPLQKNLIATSLAIEADTTGWQIGNIRYPEPITATLGFQSEALSLYQGNIQIGLEVSSNPSPSKILPLQLGVQACNDQICLPPEKLVLSLPMSKLTGQASSEL